MCVEMLCPCVPESSSLSLASGVLRIFPVWSFMFLVTFAPPPRPFIPPKYPRSETETLSQLYPGALHHKQKLHGPQIFPLIATVRVDGKHEVPDMLPPVPGIVFAQDHPSPQSILNLQFVPLVPDFLPALTKPAIVPVLAFCSWLPADKHPLEYLAHCLPDVCHPEHERCPPDFLELSTYFPVSIFYPPTQAFPLLVPLLPASLPPPLILPPPPPVLDALTRPLYFLSPGPHQRPQPHQPLLLPSP